MRTSESKKYRRMPDSTRVYSNFRCQEARPGLVSAQTQNWPVFSSTSSAHHLGMTSNNTFSLGSVFIDDKNVKVVLVRVANGQGLYVGFGDPPYAGTRELKYLRDTKEIVDTITSSKILGHTIQLFTVSSGHPALPFQRLDGSHRQRDPRQAASCSAASRNGLRGRRVAGAHPQLPDRGGRCEQVPRASLRPSSATWLPPTPATWWTRSKISLTRSLTPEPSL